MPTDGALTQTSLQPLWFCLLLNLDHVILYRVLIFNCILSGFSYILISFIET